MVSKLLQFFVKTRFKIEANISHFFYTYKKTNDIFLKFHHFLLRMPIIVEIGLIVPAEKRDYKT